MNKIGCECESWASLDAFGAKPGGHHENCPNAPKGRELPIIMDGDSVRAILEGRKTQTRRAIYPQPKRRESVVVGKPSANMVMISAYGKNDEWGVIAPYHIGDLLWVQEEWFAAPDVCQGKPVYKTDASKDDLQWFIDEGWEWKSAMSMPKEKARIWLLVTDARAQRIREITLGDIEKEGVAYSNLWKPDELNDRPFEEKWWDDCHFWTYYPKEVFKRFWDELNAQHKGYSWGDNPWVWVYEFKVERIEK